MPYAVTVSGVAPPTPYAWWPINEGTGTTILDNVGGIDGTIIAPAAGINWFNDPIRGWVLDFSGADGAVEQYVDFGSPAGITQNHGDFTAAVWVKPDAIVADSALATAVFASHIEAYGDPAYNSQYFIFWFSALTGNPDGSLYAFWKYGTDLLEDHVTAYGYITAGVWQHICAVRDTSTKQVHWYVNGVLKESANYINEHTGGASCHVTLGRLYQRQVDYYSLDGKLSDVRYYQVPLTASQVAALYNATVM